MKHRKFAKNLVKTEGQQTKAYMMTYPKATKETAVRRASELLANKPEIKQEIARILDKAGATTEKACKKLKKLMDAKKQVVVDKELHSVADNPTQLETAKTVLKLQGHLTTVGMQINTDNRQVNIGGEGIDHRQLGSLTQKLSSLHKIMLGTDTGEQSGEVIDADFSANDDTAGVDDKEFANVDVDTIEVDSVEPATDSVEE